MCINKAHRGPAGKIDMLKHYKDQSIYLENNGNNDNNDNNDNICYIENVGDDFDESDRKWISEILFLMKAGMDIRTIRYYIGLMESPDDNCDEQVRILRKYRYELLEEIHDKQQSLDKLDYLIHEIKTKNKEGRR